MGIRPTAEHWRTDLRAALTAAMKRRDSVTTSAARSALAAIDNAEAPDVASAPAVEHGAIAGGVAGLGRGEVSRRQLSADELVAIVSREVSDRRAAATHYRDVGMADRADTLDAEAEVLDAWLDDTPD